MHRLRDASIGRKLVCSFGVIVALVVVMGVTSLWGIGKLQTEHEEISGPLIRRISAADAVRASAADLHFAQTRYVLLAGKHSAYERYRDVFLKTLATLRDLTPPEEDARIRLDDAVTGYEQADRQLYAAVRAHDVARADAIVEGVANDRSDELIASLEAYQKDLLVDEIAGARHNFDATMSLVRSTTIVLALLVI